MPEWTIGLGVGYTLVLTSLLWLRGALRLPRGLGLLIPMAGIAWGIREFLSWLMERMPFLVTPVGQLWHLVLVALTASTLPPRWMGTWANSAKQGKVAVFVCFATFCTIAGWWREPTAALNNVTAPIAVVPRAPFKGIATLSLAILPVIAVTSVALQRRRQDQFVFVFVICGLAAAAVGALFGWFVPSAVLPYAVVPSVVPFAVAFLFLSYFAFSHTAEWRPLPAWTQKAPMWAIDGALGLFAAAGVFGPLVGFVVQKAFPENPAEWIVNGGIMMAAGFFFGLILQAANKRLHPEPSERRPPYDDF